MSLDGRLQRLEHEQGKKPVNLAARLAEYERAGYLQIVNSHVVVGHACPAILQENTGRMVDILDRALQRKRKLEAGQ